MNFPTIKQLRYFIALVENEHFGRAAEACHVSQSAFSVAIKELENTLDAQLVDRTNKQVTITNLGREVYQQAKLVMEDMTGLLEKAAGNAEPLSGKLSLGVIPTIAPFVLPKIMPRLIQDYPNLQLYLREDQTQRVYERLMEGELDLILIAMPYELRGVDQLPLFDDPFLLASRRNSRLVNPGAYSFDELEDESIILLEDGHCLRDHALAACHIKHLDKVSRFEASSLLTLIEMVNSDLGITFLPKMVENSHFLENTDIEITPLPEAGVRQIGLAWRKGSAREEEFYMLGEYIRQSCQTEAT